MYSATLASKAMILFLVLVSTTALAAIVQGAPFIINENRLATNDTLQAGTGE